MNLDKACPHCGELLPANLYPTEDEPFSKDLVENEFRASPMSLLASGSNDETFLANPYGPQFTETPSDSRPKSGTGPRLRTDSSAGFPSINVSSASSQSRPTRSDDAEDDEPRTGTPWSTVLLASYASATTLALVWAFWFQKPRVVEVTEASQPVESRKTIGQQAGRSRTIELPEPILATHEAALKKPLRVGSLEITPMDVRRDRVWLQRTNLTGKLERRDGGKNAIFLRCRLRNISEDAVFAPLDQAFLRERDKDVVDSYLETSRAEKVYPYPLAVESEWSIVGQEFAELRPGEARDVAIVTAPDAPGDSAGPFEWRVRLRTGIGRTDVIGVPWSPTVPAPSK